MVRTCPVTDALKVVLSKKVVGPRVEREAVRVACEEGQLSERRACGLIGMNRGRWRYQQKDREDAQLRREGSVFCGMMLHEGVFVALQRDVVSHARRFIKMATTALFSGVPVEEFERLVLAKIVSMKIDLRIENPQSFIDAYGQLCESWQLVQD